MCDVDTGTCPDCGMDAEFMHPERAETSFHQGGPVPSNFLPLLASESTHVTDDCLRPTDDTDQLFQGTVNVSLEAEFQVTNFENLYDILGRIQHTRDFTENIYRHDISGSGGADQ